VVATNPSLLVEGRVLLLQAITATAIIRANAPSIIDALFMAIIWFG
jgi:hypothetical protein